MITSHVPSRINLRKFVLLAILLVPLALVLHSSHKLFAATGACTAPSTDYGTVTSTVNITGAGTYRVWSRMSAANTTANTYMLQVDTASCYTIGGSTVPTYASGATTFFANNTSNWISKTSAGTNVDVSLTAGTHTFKLIGNGAGVVLDRLVLTQDLTCTPTGTGDNCANPPDTTAPTVSITSPANNTTISSTTTVTATASDNVAVSKVEFYVDGTLQSPSDTSAPYNFSLNPASYSIGAHTLVAKAYDAAGNNASSSTVNFTVADATAPVTAITSPANNATVSNSINVTATGTDNVGVTSMVLLVDGSTSATDTTSPYSFPLNTTTLSNATHTLVVKGYDAAGNVGTSATITVTVSNTATPPPDTTPPTVSMTAPTSGASISGAAYTLGVSASDASGIKQVQFYVDNVLKSTDTSAPFSYALDTTAYSNGTHTFYAKATDNSTNLNVGTSATVSATVANTVYAAADINKDGHVNLQDFSLLATDFGHSGAAIKVPRTDIDGSGTVDLRDYSLLVSPTFPR